MKKLILFFGILCSYGLSAQVYVIDNGTVTTTCSGIFVDTGGNTAPYSSNESFTYTICPENPGQLVQLEFTDFDTLAGADIMTIFNADNATDPTTTLGEYSGNTFAESPGFISATSENPSGCLTIVFTSSPAAADNGWVANVTCFVPCQTILSQIDSAVPTPNADGYIRVCPNDEITLTGSGQFSTSDVGATYQWDLGDGTTQNGKTATFSYTTPGVYLVNLNISDTNASNDPSGCKNTNLLNQVIQVAFPTDFTGTAAESTVLCYGESMTITGIATPVPVLNQCTPPESQETFLPDGNGTSYETSIVVDCFNSDQTLDSIDQLVNICLEMEHSYLADLDISIVSPTGQTVKLHNSGTGGSANLGVPWATDEADSQSDVLTPGEGYQYCFLVDNTLPTLAGGVENGGVFIVGDGTDTYIDSFVPAGSYSSANPLSGLLGSSLNGSWTIKIKDNATKDNGYIFSWGLNFDTSIQPAALSFTPTITSEVWDADSTITNVTGNVITIQPTTAGTYCYTYRTTDDFGCNYFKDVCIDLTPEIIYVEPNDLFECSAGAPTSNFDLTQNDAVMFATTADPTNFVLTYHTTQADADADINPISTADAAAFSGTDGQVIYCRFEYLTSNCYDTNSFTLNLSITPTINPANDLIACDEGVVDGIESFALIDQTPIILGAQLAADYRVTYHTSFVDADAGTNELPDNYNNSTSPEPIFVRIQGISASICSFVSATPVFNLIVNANPLPSTLTAMIICDDDLDGMMSFDLDSQIPFILGTQFPADFTVTFHLSQSDADANLNALASPFVNTTPDLQKIYSRVKENSVAGCYLTDDIDLIVYPLPTIVVMSTLEICDDNADGFGAFDLTSMDTEARNGQADIEVSYHETLFDAENNQNPLTSPYTNTTEDFQQIFIRLFNTLTTCSSVMPLELVVNPLPIPNVPALQTVCDDDFDGLASFDLTGVDVDIIGTQTGMVVSYHTSQLDAENGQNEVTSPFANTVANVQTLHVRLEVLATACYATIPLELVVNPLPVVPVITDFVLCDDPNSGNLQAFFDLDDKDLEIINGQNSTTNYYATQNDADNGVNQLTSPFENTSNPQTLYVALTDLTTNCRTTGRFTLVVNPLPQLVTPGVLEACDDVIADGLTSIDLSLKDDEIRGGNVSYSVRYYLNQLDADADVNPLVIPYTNISNPQTIIARGENINSGCYTTVPLELTVSQAPIVNTPTPLTICDVDSDGFGSFNLTDRDLEITGGNAGFIVSYHETLLEAENETNALSSPYDNIVINTQSIFARIENPAVSTLCASIEELVLIVHPTPQLVVPSSLEACDDDTDEFIQFDLTSKAPEFLAGIPVADVTISYYETLLDAENNTNPIGVPTNYTNLTNPQDIWILVVNNATGCEKITSLELIVNPLPLVTLPTTLTLCDDNTPGDEQEQFTLEDRNTQILNGQLGLDVSYYLTLIDAEANLNPLVSPYTNITNPQTVFVRVQNTITTCHNFTTLTLEVLPIPIPRAPNNLKTCDDTLSGDGQEIFDLTINELFILNGELGVTPSYHETLLDAENGINPILDPANYTNTDTPVQTIYVRVNNDIKGCFAIINFDVIVYPLPTATAAQDLLICEVGTDNLHPFDLEAQSASILGIQDAATHLVTYHETLADAATGINPLVSPYVNTTNPQTIYVNVTNTSIGCQNSSVQFNLEVLEAAVATSPNPFALCDDNIETDGDPTNDSVFFDLLSQNVDILNGQNPGNYLVRYFASQSDADLEINELPDVFENTVNPQIIIARVDNDTQVTNPSGSLVDSSVCYETAPVTLIVNPLPIVDTDDNYILCVDTNGTEVLGPLEIETGLSDLDYTFIWKNATGTTVETASRFSPTQGGVYTLEVFDATQPTKCAAPIKIFTVVESSPPEVTAVVTTEAFAKTHVIVATATGLGVYEYSLDQGPWQDTGVFSNVNPGEHVVNVRDLKGCGIGQAIVFVIDFPKYFTPNGDGYHDTWNIIGVSDQSNAIIQIFDRYGKFLKEIRPSGYGWNGTYNGALLPSSDYWFILKYNDLVTEEPKLLKAHFSLKR